MKALIERNLPNGRNVAGVLFAPLEKSGDILNFVDVGARNGSFLLPPSYAAHARIHGFEPNREEYEKLVEGRTDAKLAGFVEPPFHERIYYPNAVWSEKTERTIYQTCAPGAVTLTGPVNEAMTRRMWREKDRDQNYFERVQRLVGTDRVQCVTLDDVWRGRTDAIDLLKVDVEGGELEVFKGARELLAEKRILLILSEFLLVPYYEPRVTLGHQHVFLDDLGYRLAAINANHFPYSWGRTSIKAKNDRWLTYAGDAIFVLDPDRNSMDEETKYRLGLACMAMEFGAFGLNLIRESGAVAAGDLDEIEELANHPPLLRRLHNAWKNVPYSAARLLDAVRPR
jgi:FkbM family methyltransferase